MFSRPFRICGAVPLATYMGIYQKEAKEKGAKAQGKRQPTPPRDVHCVRTSGKEPQLLEPIAYKFTA